ncbi:unnamed protein product, partial [Coregonus sp. 'balchen']
MGSPFAPNYANLYVGQFEESLIYKTETHPLLSKFLLSKRYIDDVFVLWEGNESSEYLKFTMQTDERKKNYLDLWIIKENDSDFDSNAKKMADKFKMRKKNEDKTISAAMMKISQKPREELLKPKPKKKNNATVFCTKYTKCSEKMKAILKKHGHILQSDKKIAHLLKEPHWCYISVVPILGIA